MVRGKGAKMDNLRHKLLATRASPLAEAACAYALHLLAREKRLASAIVEDLCRREVDIRQLYLGIFQPVQYDVGSLWREGLVSVAQEHYCTNATQVIMAGLYPRWLRGNPGPRRLLATCVQGELHELGLRMVSDFFEMEGWDSAFLGANTPTDGILSALGEQRTDVLAIGVTLSSHLQQAADLIRTVRASPENRDLRILIGGSCLLDKGNLWRELGADGTARDARDAVSLGQRLLAHHKEESS